MNNPGHLTIWLAMIAVCISSICYLVSCFRQEGAAARNMGRYSFLAFALFVTIASMALMRAILNHKFIYGYIAQYSSRDLPLEYLISSFWAGQEGSFLLWVLLGAWLGVLLVFKAGEMEGPVMFIFNLNNLFLAILLIKQSPFRTLDFTPVDGDGLNMLLQDPWMVIHPPIVFIGYAAFAVPFAYAVAGLWRRRYDEWVRPALPWTVFAFMSLGAGIIIGGYWSYKVLGWGGYWGWDPVENASLLPWLAVTGLMHGMILQQTLKKLRKTNFLLAAFSFLLIIYCTFLTRSGILADFSVHSFQDLGITGWLVLFLAVFMAISIGFFLARIREIPVSEKGEGTSYFSREFGLMAAVILLCASAVVTGLGTSAPLITRIFSEPSKVSIDFYNKTNLPIGILTVFLLGFVPVMAWGKNSLQKLLRNRMAIWAMVGVIVAGAVTAWHGYPGTGVFLLSALAGGATAMNLFLAARLIRKRITISSGAVAHLGVGLMFIGIVSSAAYDRSEKVRFAEGSVRSIMGYEMKFNGSSFSREQKGARLHFTLDVKKDDTQFVAQPDIFTERTRGGEVKRFVHPHIRRGLVSDLYISPVDYVPGRTEGAVEDSIVLKKDEVTKLHDYEITFEGFDVSGMGEEHGEDMGVGADILVTYKGSAPVRLKPTMSVPRKPGPPTSVKLPGPNDAAVSLVSVDATAKTIVLKYQGPGVAPGRTPLRTPASLLAEVSIKPGMTPLWLGTFLILLGSTIGIVRRRQK